MKILIQNAEVFDGKHEVLIHRAHIIIQDNHVEEISIGEVSPESFDRVIDAKGNVAIPGLIDSHVHLSSTATNQDSLRVDEIAVKSTRIAKDMLLRGFTTVRDAGGITYGLKKCIDSGIVDGPRIYPSNGFISQTCGHGDCRSSRAQVVLPTGEHISPYMRSGGSVIADGVPEMLKAVREQLFLGASQIKLMVGGGFASRYDPIQTVQFTYEEMKAAVDASADFGTYVMAHLYTPQSMQRAAKAGIKSFEHATFMDDETARIIRDNEIWVCPCPQFKREEDYEQIHSEKISFSKANAHSDDAFSKAARNPAQFDELIHKYQIPIVFGTDCAFGFDFMEKNQLNDFRYYKKRFGSFEGLKSATGNAHELIKLTTYQNPYSDGKLGVLEKGSYADLLVVRGNPAADLDVLSGKENMLLIMKDGKLYKNDLN